MSDAQTTRDAGEDVGEGREVGKSVVRAHLLARLDEAGLLRPRAQTEAQHAVTRARLVDRLAYMSAADLDTLADEAMRFAQGQRRNEWPSELMIVQMAEALHPRPFELAPIVSSWLRSRAGPEAVAGGYLVELYRFLRRRQRPVLPGDFRAIRDEAAENARRMERLADWIARGVAKTDDHAWVEAYRRDEAAARRLVDIGQTAREAAGGEEGQ